MAHSATHRNLLQIEDVIPDAALESTDRDEFNHQAIAGRVAELALAARTPVNIALFGPWGSGKSSVYRSMRQCIVAANSRTSVVRYDAWKYGGQSLKRNFIHSIAKQLGRDSKKYNEQLTQSVESNTLDIAGWAKNNYRSLLSGLVLAVAISAAWLLVLSTVRMLLLSTAFSTALAFNLSGAGTVLGLTLAAMLVGPKEPVFKLSTFMADSQVPDPPGS